MGAPKRVWVIDDDMARLQEPRGEFGGWYDRGPFVMRERTRLLLLLCFLLGPIVLVCRRRSAGRLLWAAVGCTSTAVWMVTAWRWSEVARWLELGRIPFTPWALGMLASSVLGILAWARTVHAIGTDGGFDAEKLRWLRHPLAAVVFGLVMPGATHLANGGAGRAALAAWNASFTGLAALVLCKSRWLWQANAASPYWPLGPDPLEWGIVITGAIGFVAALGWLAAVLDGVRCGLDGNKAGGTLRGDVLTLLVLAALATAYAASEPTALAWDANETAVAMERDGMRRVPLLMARLAQHLDPSHPGYAMHVASLLDTCGDAAGARAVRTVLQARWQEYQRLFAPPVQDDSTAAVPAPGDSIRTGTAAADSISSTPVRVDSTHAASATSLQP